MINLKLELKDRAKISAMLKTFLNKEHSSAIAESVWQISGTSTTTLYATNGHMLVRLLLKLEDNCDFDAVTGELAGEYFTKLENLLCSTVSDTHNTPAKEKRINAGYLTLALKAFDCMQRIYKPSKFHAVDMSINSGDQGIILSVDNNCYSLHVIIMPMRK